MSTPHICSSCGEPTNLQVWTKDVCPTDRGDEIRAGWEWFCTDCYSEMVPESEREDDREPDYDFTPYEESRSYRESMMDAGRGHLLR